MARYTEAVCRLCRRSGDKLFLKGDRCFTPKCSVERRPKPPGHRISRRRVRISDRGLQLREKQKARYIYGTMEKQFRRFFGIAERMPGVTGDNLAVLLERRLDNVIYRFGFADSRAQARQIVRHGHIMLNGHKTNIPSCLVKEGDVIAWREGSTKTEYYKVRVETVESKQLADWLSLDRAQMVGRIVSLPSPESAETKYDRKAIIEHYSR